MFGKPVRPTANSLRINQQQDQTTSGCKWFLLRALGLRVGLSAVSRYVSQLAAKIVAKLLGARKPAPRHRVITREQVWSTPIGMFESLEPRRLLDGTLTNVGDFLIYDSGNADPNDVDQITLTAVAGGATVVIAQTDGGGVGVADTISLTITGSVTLTSTGPIGNIVFNGTDGDVPNFTVTLADAVITGVGGANDQTDATKTDNGYDNGDFLTADRPDLIGKAVAWNATTGGLDFTYTAMGESNEATTAKVYWAKGTTYADRLSDTAVFTHTIEAGDRGSKPEISKVHVMGSLLKNALPGTTHLIVVLDPDNSITEADEDNNVVALADVEITYGGNPPARQILSDYTIGIIKDALRYAGEASAEINSTYRTPEEQADEMLAIINGPGGLREAKSLYSGKLGKQVIKVYEDAKREYDRAIRKYQKDLDKYNKKPRGQPPQAPIAPEYRSLMAARIAAIVAANPDTAFAHTRDFSRWNVVDIRSASVESKTLFHEALTGDARIFRVLDPINSSDRAFHIEVRLI